MQNNINIIQHSLENKVLNHLINDPYSSVQDILNAYDLFILSFFLSFNNYKLSSLNSCVRISGSNEDTNILNFLSTKIELYNGNNSIISLGTNICEEKYELLDENKNIYTYHAIQFEHSVKKQGRNIPVKYEGISYSIFRLFLIKNFNDKIKSICQQLLERTSHIDFSDMWLKNNKFIQRINIDYSIKYKVLSEKTKNNILEKENLLIFLLEESNSHLIPFIENYKMSINIPTNSIQTTKIKF